MVCNQTPEIKIKIVILMSIVHEVLYSMGFLYKYSMFGRYLVYSDKIIIVFVFKTVMVSVDSHLEIPYFKSVLFPSFPFELLPL